MELADGTGQPEEGNHDHHVSQSQHQGIGTHALDAFPSVRKIKLLRKERMATPVPI